MNKFDDIEEDRDDLIDDNEDENEDDDDDTNQELFSRRNRFGDGTINDKESLMYSDHTASLNATSLNFAFSATKSNLAVLSM